MYGNLGKQTSMKTLDELAIQYHTDKSSLEHDYCRHYQTLFGDPDQWRSVLEFGVENGNSLRMWYDYAINAHIIGVDSDPKVASLDFRSQKISLFIGKQQDNKFLQEWVIPFGPFNLIIDDASHRPADQIITWNIMWPYVAPGGFYSIEDLQTSFIPEYTNGHPPIYMWLAEKIWLHSSDLLGKQHNPGDVDMIYFTNDLVIFKKK